ncbi:hypothetical protein GCM10008018_71500 [Paenibacillus marchantiophytorum]|uniref:Uncharacterized protein n=1 Tax=Paenibacillus marchantiophytorum TaxID=1619310 RepID=A0ABQ1FK82_9BACL|nr:hypothetical protein [Paenibacillus marchantiophytorum]GGA16758.1 hypothetical protein GCM10008018_71500 [Paenibacillus marchantiophytorum]
MKHICPVCGYDELQQAPYDADGNESFEICHCCAFEFGFDDIHEGHTFESYRNKWMSAGATWFYEQSKPEVWELNQQLKNIERIQPMYIPFWKKRSTPKWIEAGKILASNSTDKVPCPECGYHFLTVQDVPIMFAHKIERIISCPSCFAIKIILLPYNS